MKFGEASLSSVLIFLRHSWLIIAGAWLLIVAIAVFAILSLTPTFTAGAVVLVDLSRRNLLAAEQTNQSAGENYRMDSEVELVRSNDVLQRVVNELDLTSDAEFVGSGVPGLRDRLAQLFGGQLAAPPTSEERLNIALTALRAATDAQRSGLTYLLWMQATSDDRNKAVLIANTLARAYVDTQREAKVQAIMEARDALQASLGPSRAAIAASEASMDAFITTNLDQILLSAGSTSLAELGRQWKQTEATVRQTRADLALASDAISRQEWTTAGEILGSDLVLQRDRELKDLTAQSSGQVSGTPGADQYQAEVAVAERNLEGVARDALSASEARLEASEAARERLQQQIRAAVLATPLSLELDIQISELRANVMVTREQYQNLLERTQEMQAQLTLQLPDSRIVSLALPPTRPGFPNVPLLLALSCIAGLAGGLAIAYLRDALRGGFISPNQVEGALGISVSGLVPRSRKRRNQASIADVMISPAPSPFADAVRNLRLVLEPLTVRSLSDNSSGNRALVVVMASPTDNDGRTALALALARSFALSDRKTVLIDWNVRNPQLQAEMNIETAENLDQRGNNEHQENVSEHLVGDPLSPLQIILPNLPNNSGTSPNLTLVKGLMARFDTVIIDAPAINHNADALYLANAVDKTVLLVRWGKSPRTMISSIIDRFRQSEHDEKTLLLVLGNVPRWAISRARRLG